MSSSFMRTSSGSYRELLSFPTRRSSDLRGARLVRLVPIQLQVFDGDARRLLRDEQEAGIGAGLQLEAGDERVGDRKSTRLNSSHSSISYAVFCLKKKTRLRRPISEHGTT